MLKPFQILINDYRISSRVSFDNKGLRYDVSRVINDDLTFNVEKYQAYSPLFLSTTFAIAYGLSFASITATISHTFIYFRKQLMIQAKRSMNEQPDIHARLMSRYPQVPEWWYGVVFGMSDYILFDISADIRIRVVTMFAFGTVSIELWETDFPVWALVVALVNCISPLLGSQC